MDKFFQLDVTAFLFFNADAEEYLISFMIVDLQDQIKYDYDSTGIFHWTHHRFLQKKNSFKKGLSDIKVTILGILRMSLSLVRKSPGM